MSDKYNLQTLSGSISIGKGDKGETGERGPIGPKGDNNVCVGLSPTSEAEIWFDTNDGISGEEIATKKFVEATNEELSSRLDNLIISNGDGNKDSELIDARNGETTLGNKIRKIDESLDKMTYLITNYKTDTNTWDDALDLCIKSCENGGKISFPIGEYIITKNFDVSSNIIIDFNGSTIKSNDELETRTICLKGSNIQVINGKFINVQISIGVSEVDQENIIVRDNCFNRYDRAIHSYGSNKTLKNVLIEKNTIMNQKHESEGASQAFCAIGFHGNNVKVENCFIRENIISKTRAFGIQFYALGDTTYCNVEVDRNIIEYTGVNIPLGSSNYSGSGGIYSGGNTRKGVRIINNTIRYINEVGIEGAFYEVSGNYIEDTGYDALNRYIGDNAGIFGNSVIINNNIVVNSGSNGGFHVYSTAENLEFNLINNTFINTIDPWRNNNSYKKGDLVLSNDKYYICKKEGTSGSNGIDGKTADINDGSVVWDYKKDCPIYAVRINTPNKPKLINVNKNTIIDFKTAFYCPVSEYSYYKNNSIIYEKIEEYPSCFLVATGETKKTEITYNKYRDTLLNEYFEVWDDKKPSNFSTYNGNISQEDGTRNRKIPKITNLSTNGTGLATPLLFTEDIGVLLVTIRFKTNNGLHFRHVDSNGWRSNITIEDTSEEFVTRQIICNTNKAQENLTKFELFNVIKTDTTGVNYVTIDWIKIEFIC